MPCTLGRSERGGRHGRYTPAPVRKPTPGRTCALQRARSSSGAGKKTTGESSVGLHLAAQRDAPISVVAGCRRSALARAHDRAVVDARGRDKQRRRGRGCAHGHEGAGLAATGSHVFVVGHHGVPGGPALIGVACAVARVQQVVAGATDQAVATWAADERVVSAQAAQRVVAGVTRTRCRPRCYRSVCRRRAFPE
jgi:hypothetical protein